MKTTVPDMIQTHGEAWRETLQTLIDEGLIASFTEVGEEVEILPTLQSEVDYMFSGLSTTEEEEDIRKVHFE